MSNRYAKLLAEVTADNTKAQNTDFLATDFQVTGSARKCVITAALGSAVRLRLSPSSGSPFSLNGGSSLGAAAVHTFEVLLDPDRTWNLQTDDAAGATLRHLRIVECDL